MLGGVLNRANERTQIDSDGCCTAGQEEEEEEYRRELDTHAPRSTIAKHGASTTDVSFGSRLAAQREVLETNTDSKLRKKRAALYSFGNLTDKTATR